MRPSAGIIASKNIRPHTRGESENRPNFRPPSTPDNTAFKGFLSINPEKNLCRVSLILLLGLQAPFIAFLSPCGQKNAPTRGS
jgi:hypothetical protein